MLKPHIYYLVISDIHLGHRNNPTSSITENLKNVIGKFSNKPLDIIFIAGDLFDRLLDNSMPDTQEAHLWMCWLLRFCEEHNIKLRVLEGTRSHDRGQSSQFATIYHIAQTSLDYLYIPYLHIEKMEDLGISVLYVPDEWHEDTQETYKQVELLLQENSLRSVDIAIMHGQFGYQLPNAPMSVPRHKEEQYLQIVDHYIHIGHVHVYSQFERIIAQGSFDRLAHGEEDPKGFVYAEIRQDGSHEHHFIENKDALIFKTIKVRAMDLEASIAYLDKQISKYPIGSNIRIHAKKDHPVFMAFSDLEIRYAQYRLTKKTDDKEDDSLYSSKIIVQSDYQAFSITKENLNTLLTDSLATRKDLTPPHWVCINKTLQELTHVTS